MFAPRCPNQHPVIFAFMTNHRILNKRNMTGATSGADTDFPCFTLIHEPNNNN